LFFLGLALGLCDNLIEASLRPHAFENRLDAALFVTVASAATATLCGLTGLLGGFVGATLLRLVGIAPDRGERALLTLLGAGPFTFAVLLLVNDFVHEFKGDLPSAMATTAVATGALALSAVATTILHPERLLTSRLVALPFFAVVALGAAAFAVRIALPTDPAPDSGDVSSSSDRVTTGSMRLPPATNVMLILVDTLRADHLSYAGYVRETSPRIDALAEAGVVFEQVVGQATRTSPNMASLLTGTSFYRHGLVLAHTKLPRSLETWGELLQQAGYRTAGILGNPNVGPRFDFTQGIEHVEETFHEPGGADAEPMVRRSIELLEGLRDERFFLWLQLIDPHIPYDPPAPYDTFFEGDAHYRREADRILPLTGPERHGGISHRAQLEGLRSFADYVSRYDGEIRYADHWIGELVDALERLGLREETLIVFTSDHGESLGEHDYFFSHGTYSYEATARVPLVLSHPGLARGLRIPEMVRTVDILPTVLELLRLPIPREVEGRSLVPLLRGESLDERPASITSGFDGAVKLAERTGRWKLVLNPVVRPGLDAWTHAKLRIWPNRYGGRELRHRHYRSELYDIVADPHETINRSGESNPIESELLGRILARVDAAGVPEERDAVEIESLDPELQDRLRELGYVD
jgi:arylsulfatase A-like enzyme